MDFPDRGLAILQALYRTNPGLTTGSDDQQRLFMRLVAEQMCFELGPMWGVKSASPTRPQGGSEIAFKGPPLLIWRTIDGDGSVTKIPGAILPAPLQIPINQSMGQNFIPVDPIDHLQVTVVPPLPSPAAPAPPDPLLALEQRFDHLETMLNALGQELEAIHQAQPATWRTSLFGINVTLRPGPP